MIAVGIDVSKSKSTVAILDSYGTVLATPFNMAHTQPEMNALVSRLKAFGEPVTILLEYTGHYHLSNCIITLWVMKVNYQQGIGDHRYIGEKTQAPQMRCLGRHGSISRVLS